MREYILCYSWTGENGTIGFGNQSIEVDVKQMTMSTLEMLIADIKKRYNYKELVILNIIPLGEGE